MLFNSWSFALFLPLVFLLYWSVRSAGDRAQNAFIIAASYLFYGFWDYRFLALIVLSSATDYVVGLGLAAESRPRYRRWWLGASLAVNLGVLGFFKYFNFFAESMGRMLSSVGMQADVVTLHVILPVGISFYTFQTLSYTIDVYRRRVEPTRDVLAFFAFVGFFPQLVAGPVERAKNLLPQFLRRRTFDLEEAKEGLRLMLWGFFKKVVVADNLAPHVDAIFANSASVGGGILALGLVLFAFQIYGDFSGYSDIAVGVARLFRIRLMRNFAYPYFARDIGEFWRRWHISLSSWFRDYVYIPLGGNRTSTWWHVRNVMVTFGLSGLWHGANWTFVVWGLLHGLYYLPLMLRGRHRPHDDIAGRRRAFAKSREVVAIGGTFAATTVAWAFFRAESLSHAVQYLGGIAIWQTGRGGVLDVIPLAIAIFSTATLVLVEWLQRDREHGLDIRHLSPRVRWAAYLVLALAVAFLGNVAELQFIYFQF